MNEQIKTIVVGNIFDNGYDSEAGRVFDVDGISPCIGASHFQQIKYIRENKMEEVYDKALNQTPKDSKIRIRKLTPKECWRLMGFDDESFERAEKVNSNTQLYKQAGNSIVVNVLMEILKPIVNED